MVSWLRGYVLYAIVLVIALLLLGDIYLIFQNNRIITVNKAQQEQAEKIKVLTSEVIRSIHLLDLAVRSYALVTNVHFDSAIQTALRDNNNALTQLEPQLKSQQYDMSKFYRLRDSIQSYIVTSHTMIDHVKKGDEQSFVAILTEDPGYRVWLQYVDFSKDVNAFEDKISQEAKLRYERALNNIYILQIVLFFMAIPTLTYMAYYTTRSLSIAERLRKSEAEKASILFHQNQLLEQTVSERTSEILAQNEEITSQNEEIVLHNERLVEAKNTIEDQHKLIQKKNADLALEVQRQTQGLKQANVELTEHNNRLEQFAFIVSHNLRAPMSRIVGLSSILEFTKDVNEVSEIVSMMLKSTHDLDQIIKDLTLILGIQKMDVHALERLKLDNVLNKVIRTLDQGIKESNATISIDFSKVNVVKSLSPYIESIFYNLLSNAIKYKHPERRPTISIVSALQGDFVRVDFVDNGLGLDLENVGDGLFNLYKRFHSHVEGKGMGLYLVKTQLAALGGKIEIKSKEGEGTVFSVFIKSTSVK
jgi:signal transduction histidine kinase